MKTDHQLSPLGKCAQSMIRGDKSSQYLGIRYSALALLIVGLNILGLELSHKEQAYFPAVSMAIIFIIGAITLFQRPGFMELIDKEYKPKK